MKLLVATKNKGKRDEIASFFKGAKLQLLTLDDLGLDAPEETGHTFLANARIKAQYGAKQSGLWTIGEDSGLEVDALDGAPGIYSARYAGEGATDEENNAKLLQDMAHLKEGERAAGFRACIVLADASGKMKVADGRCRGVILHEPRGSGGFGYDPLFYVPALEKTFAEMTTEEKQNFSHRGMALRNLVEIIDTMGFLTYH